MTAAERQQVLVEWNATVADYPLERCLHHWIEDQAERAPEGIAVLLAGSGERLTYRELNARANQLARHLRHLGDGWSQVVLYREVLELLDAFQTGRPHRLRPLRIQYKDFAAWQNARSFAREESYWLERLAELPDQLRLPYDFAQTDPRDFRGDMARTVLEGEVVAGLRALARRKGTTLSNVMLVVFELFLYQWTRQNDICVGLSAANRNHPDLENLIGFFVNIVPIRCQVSDDLEFDDLLALVVERTYEAFEHQDYPFDLLIRKLNPARYTNRQPLVNVIYGFQNFADVHVDVLDRQPTPVELRERTDNALDWTMFDFTFGTSKFDLTLFVFEDADELQLTLEFDSTLFLAKTILQQLETI
jgi:non-ribosomal peptide synthetase component F